MPWHVYKAKEGFFTVKESPAGQPPPSPSLDSFDSVEAALAKAREMWVTHTPTAQPLPYIILESLDGLVRYCIETQTILYAEGDDLSGYSLKGKTAMVDYGRGRLLVAVGLTEPTTRHRLCKVRDVATSVWIPDDVLKEARRGLADDMSDVRRVSSIPIRRSFVYFDISDFSKYKPIQQVFAVSSLLDVATNRRYWSSDELTRDKCEAMMCIGDGYIFVLKDALSAVRFAGGIARITEMAVAHSALRVDELHFRIGVHCGEVWCFWDKGLDGWNYIGEGINGGQRVLSVIGRKLDDVVCISSQVRKELQAKSGDGGMVDTILESLVNKGRLKDKHGQYWRVYQLDHTTSSGLDIDIGYWTALRDNREKAARLEKVLRAAMSGEA